MAGYDLDDSDWMAYGHWRKLGTWMEKIPGLKDIMTVHDITKVLDYYAENILDPPCAKLCEQVYEEFCDNSGKYVEFFDSFPDELVKRCKLSEEDIPEAGSDSEHRGSSQEAWIEKRIRPVFGWWRKKYPAVVI